MSLAYDAKNSSVTINYKVAATGNPWFPVTIGSTDSPDYTSDKVAATAQCQVLSPNGQESV